mgnify:CR=1 FL=1
MLSFHMETLLPLVGFAVAASVTPGPNNVMVAANAANNGLRATVPHVVGIAAGFGLMIVLVGIGFAGLVTQAPAVAQGMRVVSLGWLLYLAWRIASAPLPGHGEARPPIGFVGAALFQWINPKAWLLSLSLISAWIVPSQAMVPQLALVAGVFAAACVPSCALWALIGVGAARALDSPARLRAFNVAMAVLLVVSMVPAALGE